MKFLTAFCNYVLYLLDNLQENKNLQDILWGLGIIKIIDLIVMEFKMPDLMELHHNILF